MKVSEQDALEVLVDLFDWLDGLEPQMTTRVVSFHRQHKSTMAMVTRPLAQQAMELRRAVKESRTQEEVRFRWINQILIGE